MLKNKKNQDNKTIKLPQLIWMGFNYVLGVGFLITVLKVFNYSGIHSIWILMLTSLVVGGAALAFMRNAQVYSDSNGGASEYNRRNFGPFMGWMIGFFQWTLGPIGASVNILILLEFSLSGIITENIWGNNTALFLRLISMVIFLIVSLIAIWGLKQFKIVFNVVSFIKWLLILTIIISAIVIIWKSKGQNYLELHQQGGLTSVSFNSSFLLFFYAFSGFENFVVISKNVEKPKKSMPKAIMFTIISAAIFYIVTLVLIMGTIEKSMELEKINVINLLIINSLGVGALFLGVIAQIFSRISTDLQNPLYAGAFLQSMAEQKYLPVFFKKINPANNLPQRAMWFNLIFILVFAFFWLIMPYLANIKLQKIDDLIWIYSMVTLIVYSSVIIGALKLLFTKKIKVRFWEPVLWIISLLFLFLQIGIYLIQIKEKLAGVITLFSLITISILWYFTYIKKQHKVIISTPENFI